MKKYTSLISLVLLGGALVALSGTFPPPEKDEVSIIDLKAKSFSLDGKVVEAEFTYLHDFEQVASGKYTACIHYYKGTSSATGEHFLIPEEGKEFFEELAAKGYGSSSTKTVYILVHREKPIRAGKRSFKYEAIGTKYRKSKGEYSW